MSKQSLTKHSREFFELVRSFSRTAPVSEVGQALALWCRNQPRWYQDSVWDAVGIPACQISPADERLAQEKITRLASSLHRSDTTCLFLMRDARRLAEAYRAMGGDPVLVTYGRDSIPGNRLDGYFSLFSVVNRAALDANEDWEAFEHCYEIHFGALIKTASGRQIDQSLERALGHSGRDLSRLIASGRSIVLVDTGMQGTFALALATRLRMATNARPGQIDVQLLAVYPWLRRLFRGKYVTTNASVVISVEEGLSQAA